MMIHYVLVLLSTPLYYLDPKVIFSRHLHQLPTVLGLDESKCAVYVANRLWELL